MITTSRLDANGCDFNNVAGNQYVQNTFIAHPPVTEHLSLQPFNDVPIGLLPTHFTGRRRELDFLCQVFSGTSHDVPIRCVVYGMPGIGKTSLILQYAVESFNQGWFSHVLWTSGTTVEKLNKGLAKILDLIGHPERHGTDQDSKLTAACRWLEGSHGDEDIRWLLVVDNVHRNVLGFLREHLPRWNAHGCILFTTRSADVADALVDVTGHSHRKLEMRTLDMRDTTNLFFLQAGIQTNVVTPAQKREAEKLVKAIGSLPLAIVQAASYMKQTRTPLGDMLQLCQGEHKGEMLRWENDLTSYQERSVMATFAVLFSELDRDSSSVASFLKLLSFLDPERIPLTMLLKGAKTLSRLDKFSMTNTPQLMRSAFGQTRDSKTIPLNPVAKIRDVADISFDFHSLLTVILSPVQLHAVIGKLQSLSLLERFSDDDQFYLRIHDLVQCMVTERAKEEHTYSECLRSAVSLVCGAFDHVEEPELPEWWTQCEQIMPHLHSLNERWREVGGVNLDLAKADVKIAKYLISQGRYDEAGDLCNRSVQAYRKECGSEHQDTLAVLHTLSEIYYWQGRYDDSQAAGEQVTAAWKTTLGIDHKDTLASMNILALVYMEQRRFSKAEELFKRVLAGSEKNLGSGHCNTWAAMDNLAQVYYCQERYEDAERLFMRTLAGREKNFGRDHVDTRITVHNLALVYKSQERYPEAEALYIRALQVGEQQLGIDHPENLTTIFCLARLCQSQERYDEAEECFEYVLAGRIQLLGASHPHTEQAAVNLANLYQSQGRSSEAEDLLGSIRVHQEPMHH